MFPVRIATATTIRPCSAGYYCTRGTPAYLATRNRCPVGYYCPVGTASDKAKDIRCPRKTTSSTGASELLQCNIEPKRVRNYRIAVQQQLLSTDRWRHIMTCSLHWNELSRSAALRLPPISKQTCCEQSLFAAKYCTTLHHTPHHTALTVDVCDKLQASADDPQEDVSYYPKFEYTLLDGTGTAKFDSTPAKSPTGEVEVLVKVLPINTTASVPTWRNDTVEVLRACPAYSSGAGGVAAPTKLTVIGRNFRDSAVLTCRFAACGGSDAGPLRCRTLSGDDAGMSQNHCSSRHSASLAEQTPLTASTY
eukprot:20778-Heterococcus_DN1.PRE.2